MADPRLPGVPGSEGDEAVPAAADQFRAIVERAPVGVLLVDRSGAIVFANEEACRIFGYERGELAGISVDRLVPADLAPDHARLRSIYAAEPSFRPMASGREFAACRKDGSLAEIEVALSPSLDGAAQTSVAIVVDVAERRRSQRALEESQAELEQSNQDLNDFVHVMSHDLRSPLRGIRSLIGFIEADVGDDLPATTRGHLGLIDQRAGRLQGLIDDLTSYASAGRKRSEPVLTDLSALLRDSLDVVAEDGQPTRVGGVKYTIKGGVVYDARELLADVRAIVEAAREERGKAAPGP